VIGIRDVNILVIASLGGKAGDFDMMNRTALLALVAVAGLGVAACGEKAADPAAVPTTEQDNKNTDTAAAVPAEQDNKNTDTAVPTEQDNKNTDTTSAMPAEQDNKNTDTTSAAETEK
jgi:hypothetical protein